MQARSLAACTDLLRQSGRVCCSAPELGARRAAGISEATPSPRSSSRATSSSCRNGPYIYGNGPGARDLFTGGCTSSSSSSRTRRVTAVTVHVPQPPAHAARRWPADGRGRRRAGLVSVAQDLQAAAPGDSCGGVHVWGRIGQEHAHPRQHEADVRGRNLQQV
ncbi:unnamed protein product [Merluccius merluccius]